MTRTLYACDVYKQGHMQQYVQGTEKIFSYLCARSDKEFSESVFFGLQYYLDEYLSKPIRHKDVADFLECREDILGPTPSDVSLKLFKLADLGYWPLKIKAIPEGTVVPVKNALFTIENTHPDFYWAVGYVESLLLKVWYPTTVATRVRKYRKLVDKIHDRNSNTAPEYRDFFVHDFGYRSDNSEESAAISGAAHLIFFRGSDTIPAYPFIKRYYGPLYQTPMLSVPATEHSVMCSYGKDGERQAFERMLELYPTGIVSIVSDTYDIWHVCTNFLPQLKDRILSREGKVVVRPDSGNPPDIICGDPIADVNSPAYKGVLRLLDDVFGHTVNDKGFKVLNNKIGLIYGDGMYYERYQSTLERMEKMGYAAENLVVGIGGILRQGTRDTLGFAMKATYVEVNGEPREIFKDPVTGKDKKSHKGLMVVDRDENGIIITRDQVSAAEASGGLLVPVFQDGEILKRYTFNEVRKNALGI